MRYKLFILVFLPITVFAKENIVEQYEMKMPPIDTTPASFVLGASPNNILSASNYSDFVTGVSKGLKNGSDASAVSVQVNPALAGKWFHDWNEIVNSNIKLVLAQTTISFANIIDGKEANGLESAVGLQSVYSLKMKKIQDTLKFCMQDIFNEIAGLKGFDKDGYPIFDGSPEELNAQKERLLEKYVSNCKPKIVAIRERWNDPSVAVGYAHGFKAKAEDVGGVKTADLDSYWITAQYGADFNLFSIKEAVKGPEVSTASSSKKKATEDETSAMQWLLTAHARQSDNIFVKDDKHALITDQTLYGLNLKLGNEKLRGIAEFSYFDNKDLHSKKAYLAGVEFPIFEKNFITLGVVGDNQNKDQGVVAKFSWQLNDKFTLPVSIPASSTGNAAGGAAQRGSSGDAAKDDQKPPI